MSLSLSIKDVPDAIAERLRQRAARNHRSLQGELMAIIEQAAAEPAVQPMVERGAAPGIRRSWTQGHKAFDQLLAEREAAGWTPHPSLADAPLAVDIIRADRDSR